MVRSLLVARGGRPTDAGELIRARGALFRDDLTPGSKAARCYLLLERGLISLPLAPRSGEPVVLASDATVEDAAILCLLECLDQIATNLVVVERLDDPEGAHQLRRGLRGLRLVFAAYAPLLFCPEALRLETKATILNREVGRLRDLEVAGMALEREAHARPQDRRLRALSRHCAKLAGKHRQQLRRQLDRTAVRSFLVELAQFIDGRAWRPAGPGSIETRPVLTVPAVAEAAIGRYWDAVKVHLDWLGDLDSATAHNLRKQVRNLRSTIDLFQSLYGPDMAGRSLAGLKKLQTALGDLNDAVALRSMLTSREMPWSSNPHLERAVGRMVAVCDRKVDDARNSARSGRSKVLEIEPFWKAGNS